MGQEPGLMGWGCLLPQTCAPPLSSQDRKVQGGKRPVLWCSLPSQSEVKREMLRRAMTEDQESAAYASLSRIPLLKTNVSCECVL